ncbi:methionyl-tRNA synthetase [Synechococcus sp. PCC 7335]|uniref:methionine--tRNA ligase n=1 Tax=Synechococcus sp. (strain ATCC 29403 / PCC 7335) TaxID=91464 RepID=UPI00017EB0D2|nr:methionine--tRNA ligase [Synechococcus sp. PCC 7335]EDX83765.1 methionyl-tRNA synthetase [Synechococcus sp. PCC 7335]
MRHLITSALPYINGIKHLGNLVGSMLPADVYARFLRQEGEEVLYICATDEHGTPAEIAAVEEGLEVAEFCQRQYERQADIYQQFGLSFDYFGRTSSVEQKELTQYFYRRLDEQGYIEERETSQVYSIADQRFLPDRYVEGTCPNCGYERARGDQCENCTKLLSPTELIEPRSAISGSTNVEVRASRHLFLRLDQLSDDVRRWVDAQTNWPNLTRSIAYKWLDEGLQSRGITRDLKWGVPVPKEGFEDKVFYVWFDAPIGYVSATKAWSDQQSDENTTDWKSWWYDADDVSYTQFMAKDNLPFHTIMWPATILGTKEPWKMANYIKGFNWLNYYGGKFSTSSKRGVFLDQALEIAPADYWRYMLMASAPESADSAFTWEQFQTKVNKELADNFGNFINRILKFTVSRFGNELPAGGEPGEAEAALEKTCKEMVARLRSHLQNMEFRKATETLNALWSAGNQYIDVRAPWTLFKQDKDEAAVVIRTCINLIRLYAIASSPFIPATSQQLFDALQLTKAERNSSMSAASDLTVLKAGRTFELPPVLIQKIDDDRVAELKAQYGGD